MRLEPAHDLPDAGRGMSTDSWKKCAYLHNPLAGQNSDSPIKI